MLTKKGLNTIQSFTSKLKYINKYLNMSVAVEETRNLKKSN